jgi:hypothetical protein
MFPEGFEHAFPAGERPQIHSLDSATTGNGLENIVYVFMVYKFDSKKYEKIFQ